MHSNLYLNTFVQLGQRIELGHFLFYLYNLPFCLSQRIKRKCINFQLHTMAICTNIAENIKKLRHFT